MASGFFLRVATGFQSTDATKTLSGNQAYSNPASTPIQFLEYHGFAKKCLA